MDENKEFLNKETNFDTDTENSLQDVQDTAEEANYYGDAFSDDAPETASSEAEETQPTEIEAETEAAPKEKSGILMKPIFIAACIVVCAVIAVLVLRLFFNSSIEGTWHYVREVQVMANDASADEPYETISVDYYFNFGKDNTVTATLGTVTSKGTYEIYKNDDGKSVITMDLTDLITSYSFLPYSEYELNVSGNAFTGRKITMTAQTNDQSEPSVFEFESSSYTAPEVKREGEFKLNEGVVGTWVYNQDNYNLVYEFKNDGTASYHEQVNQVNIYTGSVMNIDYTLDGLYNVTDDTITVYYYYTKDSSMDISYKLDEDTLYINGYPFTKQGAATKD